MNSKKAVKFVMMLVVAGAGNWCAYGSIFERDLIGGGRIPQWSFVPVDGVRWVDYNRQPWESFDNAVRAWYRADYRTSAEYIELAANMVRQIAFQQQIGDMGLLYEYADRLDGLAALVWLERIEFAEHLMSAFSMAEELLARHYYVAGAIFVVRHEDMLAAHAMKAAGESLRAAARISDAELNEATQKVLAEADGILDVAIKVDWWQGRDMQEAMRLVTEAMRRF